MAAFSDIAAAAAPLSAAESVIGESPTSPSDCADFSDFDSFGRLHIPEEALGAGRMASTPFLGDYYSVPDDVVRGVTLCSGACGSVGFGEPLGSKTGSEGWNTMEHDFSGVTEFDVASLPALAKAQQGFSEGVRAPELPAAPFEVREATSVWLHGISAARAGNAALAALRRQRGVWVTKVKPAKYTIRASVCAAGGASCEIKVHIYEGSAVEFQRRGGDALAFARVLSSARSYLQALLEEPQTQADARRPRLPPAPSQARRRSAATRLQRAWRWQKAWWQLLRRDFAANENIIQGDVENARSSPSSTPSARIPVLAPLVDLARYADCTEVLAEAANVLQALVEGDPQAAMQLCKQEVGLPLMRLLAAGVFRSALPAARLLASLSATGPVGAAFLLGDSEENMNPQLVDLMISMLSEQATDRAIKDQLALALRHAVQYCSGHTLIPNRILAALASDEMRQSRLHRSCGTPAKLSLFQESWACAK